MERGRRMVKCNFPKQIFAIQVGSDFFFTEYSKLFLLIFLTYEIRQDLIRAPREVPRVSEFWKNTSLEKQLKMFFHFPPGIIGELHQNTAAALFLLIHNLGGYLDIIGLHYADSSQVFSPVEQKVVMTLRRREVNFLWDTTRSLL